MSIENSYNQSSFIDIGARRNEKKNMDNIDRLSAHRPVTAFSTVSRNKIRTRKNKPEISISSLKWKPGKQHYTTISSARVLKKVKPMEATSSFWDDGFSFNNRTLGSQGSLEK